MNFYGERFENRLHKGGTEGVLMADLMNQRIPTRENIVRTMAPSACVAFVSKTRKALPRTVAMKWQHNFLKDIEGLLRGGYIATLTPKQVGHLLRTADHAGVNLETFNNGERP